LPDELDHQLAQELEQPCGDLDQDLHAYAGVFFL
jgi:hypothetical protein